MKKKYYYKLKLYTLSFVDHNNTEVLRYEHVPYTATYTDLKNMVDVNGHTPADLSPSVYADNWFSESTGVLVIYNGSGDLEWDTVDMSQIVDSSDPCEPYGVVYIRESLTVKFNLNGHGSNTPADQTNIVYGRTITKPTDPNESGYLFLGWYESGSSVDWDFLNDTVTHNLTLNAHWVQESSATRAHVYMNTGRDYPDWNWGEIVSVNGNTVSKISDAPGTLIQSTYYYVGTYKNNISKAPYIRSLASGSSSYVDASPIDSASEAKLFVGETYRFIAGFDTNIEIYGVRLIHTDTVNGNQVETEEIIPFNSNTFIHNWGQNILAHDLIFTAHETTRIITLFKQSNNNL